MGNPRRWAAVGSAGMLVLLAGCATEPASAAATVGEARVDLAEVSDQLQAINQTLGQPADAGSAEMSTLILQNNIRYELVEQAAAAAGVSVTPTQVEERLAAQVEFVGGEELLASQAAQAGVAPQMVEADIRASLLAFAMQEQIVAETGSTPDAAMSVLVTQVQRTSEEAGTTVNPRFGVWDVASLSVAPDPDAPSMPAELAFLGSP